jgi:hypothetical protein
MHGKSVRRENGFESIKIFESDMTQDQNLFHAVNLGNGRGVRQPRPVLPYARFGGPLAALSALVVGMLAPPLLDRFYSLEAAWTTSLALALFAYVIGAAFEKGRQAQTTA